MGKLSLRFGLMVLTFTLGLAGNFLFNALVGSVVERWLESTEPVLEEPCAAAFVAQPHANSPISNRGLVILQSGADKRLKFRGEEIGSLGNATALVAKLNSGFAWRVQARGFVSTACGSGRAPLVSSPGVFDRAGGTDKRSCSGSW